MANVPFTPCETVAGGGAPTECADKSVQMLEYIFGDVISALAYDRDLSTVTSSANVLSQMFSTFNAGVLIVAGIIMATINIYAVTKTANDGKVMGDWSTTWTVARLLSGAVALAPTGTGYAVIQMFVFTVALWAIGLANTVYEAGMGTAMTTPGAVDYSKAANSTYGFRDMGISYAKSAYCRRVINSTYDGANVVDLYNGGATLRGADKETKEKNGYTTYTWLFADQGDTQLGSKSNPICGSMTLKLFDTAKSASNTVTVARSTPWSSDADSATEIEEALTYLEGATNANKYTEALRMFAAIQAWVDTLPVSFKNDAEITEYKNAVTAASANSSSTPTGALNVAIQQAENNYALSLMATMAGTAGQKTTNGLNKVKEYLIGDGWAMAGGWWQRVGAMRNKVTERLGKPIGYGQYDSQATLANLNSNSDARAREVMVAMNTALPALIKAAEGARSASDKDNSFDFSDRIKIFFGSLEAADLSSPSTIIDGMALIINEFSNAVITNVVNLAISSEETIIPCGDANEMGGSLNRMKCLGDYIVVTHKQITATAMAVRIATAGTDALAGVLSSSIFGNRINVEGTVTPLTELAAVIIEDLVEIGEELRLLGIYFSMVIPSAPYFAFAIVVVGFILQVFQCVVASLLWALMHALPERTFIGSQKQGYLMFLGLLVRPSVALIGLFAAIIILDPILGFLAEAMLGSRADLTASTGLVGAIAGFITLKDWLWLFALTTMPVIYVVLGLSQSLPDAVLNWIGAGVDDLGASNATNEVRNTGEKFASQTTDKQRSQLGNNVGALVNNERGRLKGLKEKKDKDPKDPNGGGQGGAEAVNTGGERLPAETANAQQQANTAIQSGQQSDQIANTSSNNSAASGVRQGGVLASSAGTRPALGALGNLANGGNGQAATIPPNSTSGVAGARSMDQKIQQRAQEAIGQAHEHAKQGDLIQADRAMSTAGAYMQASHALQQGGEPTAVQAALQADYEAINSGSVDNNIKDSYAKAFPQQALQSANAVTQRNSTGGTVVGGASSASPSQTGGAVEPDSSTPLASAGASTGSQQAISSSDSTSTTSNPITNTGATNGGSQTNTGTTATNAGTNAGTTTVNPSGKSPANAPSTHPKGESELSGAVRDNSVKKSKSETTTF